MRVETYLARTFHPDCEFLDGRLATRNLGRKKHSSVQNALLVWFWNGRKRLFVRAFPELRVRVAENRYRIPDVSVVSTPSPNEQVLSTPPRIAIEVLSPEDTFPKLQQRIDDYLRMGVPDIWVIDPETKRGWRATVDGHLEARDGILRTADGAIVMPLAEVFSIVDEE